MKKSILLVFVLLSFFGCNLINESDPFQKHPDGLEGRWQQVEYTGSDGANTYTNEIKDGPVYHFKPDMTYSIFPKGNCDSGTYHLDGEKLTLYLDCKHEGGLEKVEYKIIFEEDYMRLIPTSPMCIEGCSSKYKKLKD